MPQLAFQGMLIHIIVWLIFMAPTFGIIVAPFAIFGFQTKKSPLGQTHLITLDEPTYRNKATKIYIFLIAGLFLGALSFYFGIFTDLFVPQGIVSTIGMAALMNIAAKRLSELGRARAFAAMGVIPVLGHLFFIWLAYTQVIKTRRLVINRPMNGLLLITAIIVGLIAYSWLKQRIPLKNSTPDARAELAPRYVDTFYTVLKDRSDRTLADRHAEASREQIGQLKRAVNKTQASRSYASQMNCYDDVVDPEGSQVIIRIDFLAPYKFHVLQMAGSDIDEWMIDGATAWYGPLWVEATSADFVHAEAQSNIAIRQHLNIFLDHAIQKGRSIGVSQDGRVFWIDGSFGALENVSQLMKVATKAAFVLGADGYVERFDLIFEQEGENGGPTIECRYSFGAFGHNIPFNLPKPNAIQIEDGDLDISSIEFSEPPFYDFDDDAPGAFP